MSERIWFVAVDGTQREEQSSAEDVRLLLAENPNASVLVWKEGMEGWVEAGTLPELAPPVVEEQGDQPTVASAREPFPAARPAAAAAPSGRDLLRQAGLVRALFDFRFETFVTPKMIAVLYGLVMVLIGFAFLGFVGMGATSIVNGFRFSTMGLVLTGVVWIVLSPIVALVYLALARMFFELVIVLFKIKESTEKLAEGASE